MKIHQNAHAKLLIAYVKPQVSFYLNFASLFIVLKDKFCTFLVENLYDLDKRKTLKSKTSDYRLLTWIFTKFILS